MTRGEAEDIIADAQSLLRRARARMKRGGSNVESRIPVKERIASIDLNIEGLSRLRSLVVGPVSNVRRAEVLQIIFPPRADPPKERP